VRAVELLRGAGERLLRLPRIAAWAWIAAWLALIWWGSSFPGTARPSPWPLSVLSNSVHAPEFGLLAAWLALLAPRRDGWPALDARARAAIALAVLACGATDELHQHYLTPGRDLSLLDLVTDVAGALAALEIVAYLGRADRSGRGLSGRLAAAAAVSFACGALAVFVPRCFPGVGWL
jgi:VanZ family protein